MTEVQAVNLLEGFVTEREYAAARGVSLRTCQRDRQLRQGPPYIVVGRQILYRIDSIRQWLLGRERHEDRLLRPRRGAAARG